MKSEKRVIAGNNSELNQMDNLSAAQLSMIEACVATSKDEREDAVRRWEEEVAMDDLDFSSSRLIPYFFHRNQQEGITTKHDKRIKIIYKHWWLRTQHIGHRLKKAHDAFSKAGIKVVVIKGASIKTHYERAELRPMADFDLLVPLADLQSALEIIYKLDYLANGTSISETSWGNKRSLFFDYNHAVSCTHQKDGTQLDLHWKVGSRCSVEFTDDLWLHLEDYGPLANGKKPQLAYEVFMLIIHAVASENKDNLNWVIDVAVINAQNDLSFWEEARKLAIVEKKVDIFDYGCFLLIQLGVYAPDPGIVKKPRTIINTDHEGRKGMSIIKLFYSRTQNTVLIINRLFPHANAWTKLYYISVRILRSLVPRIRTKTP